MVPVVADDGRLSGVFVGDPVELVVVENE